ncbi:MAG: hypothetical protein JWO22_1526 [Frankiales bacterium]|nr:hypothetical protein [Frankiales bacterium]
MTVSRTVHVDAPATKVWELVSDLPAMGRLSPENTGGSWRGGATGPAVGATFKGSNRNGSRRWSTTVRVLRCEPGTTFAFAVSSVAGIPVSEWSYDIEAAGDGACEVTETWTDRRPGWFKKPAGLVTGVMSRDDGSTAENLEKTLAAVKALAEAP